MPWPKRTRSLARIAGRPPAGFGHVVQIACAAFVLACAALAALLATNAWADDTGSQSPHDPPWQRFESRSGGFRVLMPGDPSRARNRPPLREGQLDESLYHADHRGVHYRIEHHDIPRVGSFLLPDRVILDMATRSLIADRDGQELRFQRIRRQGLAGRRFAFQIPGEVPQLAEALVLLRGSRIYFAIIRGPQEGTEPDPRFLESFEIMDPDPSETRGPPAEEDPRTGNL